MTIETAYQEALDYLFSFIDYSRSHQENIAPENFELARMERLMAELGNPHLAYPAIHIAGTKGKGSTAALCAAGLQAGGYRVGLYTSPHLHEFTERIQVDMVPISKGDFVELVKAIKPFIQRVPDLTSYEIQTALAFWHFAREGVDAGVIEVGMGGRLDSTNVVRPEVSVIVSISLDHIYVLGDTLAAIAGEKGGIIKSGVPVVSAPQAPEALSVLRRLAADRSAPFTLIGEDVRFESTAASLEGQQFAIRDPLVGGPATISIRLLGEHQIENAAAAFAALVRMSGRGLPLSVSAIQEGFSSVQWPGRFEVRGQSPQIVFDVAHNRDSARRLWEAVRAYFPARPVTLVFGALADKDIAGMFAELFPNVRSVILFAPNHPRRASLIWLKELAGPYAVRVGQAVSQQDAWQKAFNDTPSDGLILVTGSLTTVGELRAWYTHNIPEDRYNTSIA